MVKFNAVIAVVCLAFAVVDALAGHYTWAVTMAILGVLNAALAVWEYRE